MSPLVLPQARRPLPHPETRTPSLAQSLATLAEAHGFIGGLYVHLGQAQRPGPAASQSPRVVATAGFDGRIDLHRLDFERDPLAARAVRSLTPFAWTLKDVAATPQPPFVRQLAWWGVQAGVVSPAHHHALGPAFLNLFVRDAGGLARQDFAALMLATARFHAAATAATPLARQDPARMGMLSSREVAVLRLAALGRTEQETAEALRLSRRTIQYHLASAAEKLGTPNKTAAVARAVGAGIIVLPTDEPGRWTQAVR